MKHILPVLALAALVSLDAGPAHAQTFEPLRHSGELHEDFTRGALARYRSKASRRKARGREEAREKETRNRFALQTAVALHNEHRSGSILSGDWASELVGRVGAKVAAADSAARGAAGQGRKVEPVRFYVTASPAVNAFATPDRTVYVTMGLLARIETEAQLAFILCHELGHVDLDHGLDLFLKGTELADVAATRRGRKRLADDPFAINRYSRANEQAADDYGTELYARLGYGAADAERVFEILGDSYLTFGEHRLRAADLSLLGFDVDASLILDTLVTPRSIRERLEAEAEDLAEEERLAELAATGRGGKARRARRQLNERSVEDADGQRDDDPSTHPATEERAATVAAALDTMAGGDAFDVWTPEELARLRRQARYEVTAYHLRDVDYPEAALAALSLLADDPRPDTAYLQRVLAHALIGQAVFRNVYEDYLAEEREVWERKSRRAKRLSPREAPESFPGAEYAYGELQRLYHLMAEAEPSTLAQLALTHAVQAEYLNPESPTAVANVDRALELLHATDARGYDAWRRAAPEAYALAQAEDLRLDRRYREAKKHSDLEVYNEENRERLSSARKRPARLRASRVVVALPQFRDLSSDGPASLQRSEAEAKTQRTIIQAAMKGAGVRGDVVTDRLGKTSADDLADVRVMREYLGQVVGLTPLRLVPHNYDAVMAMMQRREGDKLVYLAEANSQGAGAAGAFVGPIYYAPLMPYNVLAMLGSKATSGGLQALVIDPGERSVDLLMEADVQFDMQYKARRNALYHTLFRQVSTK